MKNIWRTCDAIQVIMQILNFNFQMNYVRTRSMQENTWRFMGLISSFFSCVISIPCCRASLSGPIEASFTKFFISDPEYPKNEQEKATHLWSSICYTISLVINSTKELPSVNLQTASISSFERLNNPSLSSRFLAIQALASADQIQII